MGRHVIVELYGCDGSYFCLSGPNAGEQGVYLGTDPEGLYDAPVKVAMKRSAFEIGGKPTAPVRPHREMLIGLGAVGDTGEEWAAVDSAVRMAFDYEVDPWDPEAEPARLDVTTTSGTRSMHVLMSESPVMKMETDPWDYGHSLLPVTLVGPQPMWDAGDWLGDAEHPAGWQLSGAASGSGEVWVRNPTDRPMKHVWLITGDGEARLSDFSWTGAKGARVPGIDFKSKRDDSGRMLWTPLIGAVNGHGARANTDRVNGIPLEDLTGTNITGLWGGNRLLYEVPPYTDWTSLPVQARNVTSPTFGILCRQPRLWSRPWGLEKF